MFSWTNKFSRRERVDKQKSTSSVDLKERSSSDKGELSQTLILVSAFAVAGITAIGGITAVLLTKGEDAANCINNANTFNSGSVDKETCATAGTSNGGGTLTPGDGGNATPGEPVGGEDGDSSEVPEEQEPLLDYAPDDCFEMNKGTIVKYLIEKNPILCGKDVVIPDEIKGYTVEHIGDDAFRQVGHQYSEYEIEKVKLPKELKTIGYAAFHRNNISGELTIPDSVTTIGYAAFRSNSLTELIISDSVTKIGHYTFGDNNLTELTIPDSVTTIEKEAFYNNNISGELIIPDSVTTIGHYAFQSNNLAEVSIGHNTTIASSSFDPNVTITRRN